MQGVFNTPAFLYVAIFTNKKKRGNDKLYYFAQDVKLVLRFNPSCVLSVTHMA
jgi:hypothetical protein